MKSELYTAIGNVQAEAGVLVKDNKATIRSPKGDYSYAYADLAGIVEKVGPLLAKHNLVFSAKPSYMENMGPSLKYKVVHSPSGEKDEDEMLLLLGDNQTPQGQGSALTYARRQAFVAVFNLVTDVDDDGAAGSTPASDKNGVRVIGKGGPASEKQVAFVRKLFKDKEVTRGEARKLLAAAGVTVADGEDPRVACARLRWPAVNELIDFLKSNPVPTGESDIPAATDDEFRHPPEDPSDTPFSDSEDMPQTLDVGPS